MNKRLYRVIFNTSRGLSMVVAENAGSHGGGPASVVDAPAALRLPMARLTGIAFAALVMTGAAMSFLPAARAQIIADHGAPKAQQPVIVNTANGLPQVNIQTPSAAGVSRNTYTQFDVQKQGAILNNSRTDVQTQLGGWVQSNPNLANGTARVILNEVNSSNPSYLRGFIEVAGDRAQVIVANPSGVTCDGCGFINANRSTLTTGTVIMNGGNLDGYLVRGGSVIVEGAGMDDRQTDFTDIIARATQINAGLWSKTLRVTSGTNQVNADNTQATRISAADAAPLFGVDVAQLGGMYANKIVMVGTEAGVGVRNAGTIGAAAGEVTITADGRIENSGSLAAQERLSIRATSQQGALSNTGSIRSVGAAVVIETDAAVDNTNTIAAQTDVNIVATALQNSGAVSAATGNLAVDTSGATDNSGRLIAAGDIKVAARQPVAGGGASDLRNSGSIEAGGLAALGTDGDLRNDGSITAQRVQTDAQGMINNGSIGARGNVALDLQKGLQQGSTGLLAATGDVTIALSGDYINAGRLQANKLTLGAANIDNQTGASLQAKEIVLNAVDRLDNAGEISASQKLAITATTFANTSVALGGDVVVQAKTLDNIGMNALLGAGNTMSLWVTDVINNRGKSIIYSGGDMAIAANSQRDANGLINAIGQITNEDSVVEAGGNLDVAAVNITNSRSNVLVNNITTVDERRTLVMPSWWHAGDNHAYYDPYSTNYSAHEYYYVNPADVLENTTVVTPDGYVIGRAVIRTHANDTAFMRDTGGGWAAYGTVRRVTVAEGTRVLYYTTSSTGVSNPDKVPGGDNLANGGVQWSMLPTYSDQYGSCTNDCIRFVTEPGYTDPNSIILRDTQRVIGVDTDTLEYWRHAHHVAVEDRLAAGAGVASEIRAGGNARIAIGQSLQNQFSNIVVNGTLLLGGAGADITNSGQTLYRRHYFDGTFVTNGGVTVGYSMPSIAEVIGTTQGAIVGRQGLDIVARNFSNADLSAGSAANIRSDVTLTTGSGQSVGGLITDAATRPDATAPGTPVPVKPNPMFTPATGGNYLLETRSQFTDHRTWLSSDYLLTALNVDPATTQKRLGDGFYEQRLVREQLGQLTGRVTGSANDDTQYQSLLNSAVSFAKEWDLRPGVALTSEQIGHLTSDIVWLETQKISLPDGTTEDVLVPKVYLAHLDKDALKDSGALVTGANVTIQAENIINKGGVIGSGNASGGGRTILVASNDLSNLGGGIRGDEITLTAGGDVRNETLTVTERYANAQNNGTFTSLSNQGVIAADSKLIINAGRDVTNVGAGISAGAGAAKGAGTIAISAGRDIVLTTAKTGSTYDLAIDGYTAHDSASGNQGSQIAAGSDLSLIAQRDVNVIGSQVAVGVNGSGNGTVLAGRDMTVAAALNESHSDRNRDDGSASIQTNNQNVSGSSISAADGLTIQAGALEKASINIVGSDVTAGKALNLAASGDVNIVTAEDRSFTSVYGQSTTNGPLSSKTNTDYASRSNTNAVSSTVSGDTTVIQAGNDLSVLGSNVVSTAGTTLVAGNNITLAAASNTAESVDSHNEKTSGLFSGGGLGVTIGTRELDNQNTSVSKTAVSANVGSTEGNVVIVAGNAYAQTGSNVLTPRGDIDILAKKVDIVAAIDSERNTQDMTFKQSGLTLAITSPVLSAIQSVQQLGQAAGKTSDSRMKVLAGAAAGMSANNAYEAIKAGQGSTIDGKDNQIATGDYDANNQEITRDANAGDQVGGINLAISIGGSKSESHSEQNASRSRESTVAAGGNVSISATGGGTASDLLIQGSTIAAGANALLKADNEVKLLAAQSTTNQLSNNKAISGSIGISIGTDGFLVNAGLSGSKGYGNGSDVVQNNTHVDAGNQLTIISGTDTTLKGAVVSGKQVTLDIGTSGAGNLNIESLQDTSTYKSDQKSLGGSISVGAGKMSGSINYSHSSVDGNYASVIEQSGIEAGDGGFNITVRGNTDLKGAKIASTDKAAADGKNSLVTETLTQSTIRNHSDYKAESMSFGLSGSYTGAKPMPGNPGVMKDAKSALGGTGVGYGSANGSESSTTQSGISAASVTITDGAAQQTKTGLTVEQTLASINTDVSSDKDTSGKLTKGWNGQQLMDEVSARAQITQAFGQQAAKEIGAYATAKVNELDKKIAASQDPQERDELAAERDKWVEGGISRASLHIAVGGLSGGIGGALGAATSALAMSKIAELISELNLPNVLQQGLEQVTAAVLGAMVGGSAGSAAGVNVEANNRQLHQSERQFAKDKAKQYQQFLEGKTGEKITSEEAYQRLLSAGYAMVDSAAEKSGKSDEAAKQFIAQNKSADLFNATAAERANPFLNGNKDGSWTPEQQARFGAKTPAETASKLVTQATTYLNKPCGANCGSKFDAINDAVKALETAKVLYQDDPKSVAILNQQIDQLKAGITKDEIVRGAAQSISNTDKNVAFALLGGGAKPTLPNNTLSSTLKAQLLTELEKTGTKLTPENVVAVSKLADGRIVFLEQGNSSAGLKHIIEQHGGQFAQMGISEAEVPNVVMKAVAEGKLVGYQGTGTGRPIYELAVNGKQERFAITVGKNGFIVGANPRGGAK